jgi:hypothetical protein
MYKAFLVGINDYAPVGPSEQDLSGCVNDVEDVANTLIICGFESKNIRISTNRRATKQGILKGLDWLIKGAKKEDSLVFYYSGHGSQVVDTDKDEIDRKDEILCPHDIDFYAKTYVADDDLRNLFSKLPDGVNLEVILDSCHSGTGTREPDKKIRFLKPPFDYTFHINYEPDLKLVGLLKKKVNEKKPEIVSGLNHVLWAACKENQTSEETEIEGKVRGVFTYHFCKILRRTNGSIQRSRLYRLVSSAIKRGGFSQIPQLEGSSSEILENTFR